MSQRGPRTPRDGGDAARSVWPQSSPPDCAAHLGALMARDAMVSAAMRSASAVLANPPRDASHARSVADAQRAIIAFPTL